MVKVARSSYGNEKIKQSISQRNIYKHVNPVINGADYHQENSSLGADYVDTHDPVNCRWAMNNPVQCEKHQKAERDAYADEK